MLKTKLNPDLSNDKKKHPPPPEISGSATVESQRPGVRECHFEIPAFVVPYHNNSRIIGFV